MNKKNSSKDWINFYKKNKKINIFNKYILNNFQKKLFNEISRIIDKSKGKEIRILSAGSGVDFVAYHLKKKYKDKINLTIFDISTECININRKLFSCELNFIVGDIFNYSFPFKFDLVYNSGLLEHFTDSDKLKILKRIQLILKKEGYYITFNPNSKGKLYTKCMIIAKKKKQWPYGKEIPISSLKTIKFKDMNIVKEYSCCSLSQLSFIKFKNKFVFYILYPLILFFRHFYFKLLDDFFGKYIGFYGLVTIFKKT